MQLPFDPVQANMLLSKLARHSMILIQYLISCEGWVVQAPVAEVIAGSTCVPVQYHGGKAQHHQHQYYIIEE